MIMFGVIDKRKTGKHQFCQTLVGGGGEGWSSELSVEVCRPVPQILTQFQTKTCHFPHPFSDLASKIKTRFQTFCFTVNKLCISKEVNINIGNIQLKWYILDTSLSLLFIWSWEDKYVYTLPWFPWKPYLFSDQNGSNAIPFGAAHTYIAFINKGDIILWIALHQLCWGSVPL